MNREEALKTLKEKVDNKNLIKHSLAVEAAMRKLAEYFNEDPDKWGICGLVHDIDYELTKNNVEQHSRKGSEMLKEWGLEEDICHAVLTHNDVHEVPPQSLMAKTLQCTDPLTGLIISATLVLPSKKIEDLEVENVLKRFKEKRFAQGANRETIKKCEDYLDLELEKFVEIVLNAMKNISSELEL